MKTIKLYGELGRKFGKIFRFDVKTPREAVRALSAQIKGFSDLWLVGLCVPCVICV